MGALIALLNMHSVFVTRSAVAVNDKFYDAFEFSTQSSQVNVALERVWTGSQRSS